MFSCSNNYNTIVLYSPIMQIFSDFIHFIKIVSRKTGIRKGLSECFLQIDWSNADVA